MKEIERKFLVKYVPIHREKLTILEIEQNYLSINPEKRIRKIGDKYFLTEKGNGNLVRAEKEVSITEKEFSKLISLCKFDSIKKSRYLIPLGEELTAEMDVYHGQLEGLVVVEVEFENIDDAFNFVPKDWFGREVTSNKSFKNKNLIGIKYKDLQEIF